MNLFDINELTKDERESFHLFSEKYLRAELKKFQKGKRLKEFELEDENLLLILIKGEISICNNGKNFILFILL